MLKRFIVILALVLNLLTTIPIYSYPAFTTYAKVQGYATKGGQAVTISSITTSTKYQASYPSCTITIYDQGTANLSTIYSDSIGTPKANPFTAASDAYWFFYGISGNHYDVQFSGTGIASPFSLGDLIAGGSSTSSSNTTQYVGSNGAVGDGTTNDRVAIQTTLDSSYTGGATIFLAKTYVVTSGLTIGDGTGSYALGTATASTKNAIVIDGQGATIKYTGSNIATAVLTVNGPILRVIVKNITIDCNALAGIGIDLNHVAESYFENVYVKNNTGNGIRHRAYANPSGTLNGANNNIFSNVFVNSTQTGASGINIGYTDTVASPRLDVAQNTFINCRFRFDGAAGTTYGIILNFVDACTFINPIVSATVAVHCVIPSGTAGSSYPSNLTFVNPALGGGCDNLGTWQGSFGLNFINYQTADLEPVPPLDATNIGLFNGFTDTGKRFGLANNNSPLLFSSVTTSSAIANTGSETTFSVSYSIPAYILYVRGALLRVRASGTYSTTGTPTLTVRVKVGGATLADPLITTANNATSYHWSLAAEGAVRFLGSTGVMELGINWLGLGGSGLATGATSGNFSLNTTIANAVTVTITWSAASASNTIVMDNFTVEISYPGSFS